MPAQSLLAGIRLRRSNHGRASACFYFLPTADIAINTRAVLKALCRCVCASALDPFGGRRRKGKSDSKPLLVGLPFRFAVPLYLLISGYFWTAGKAIGMAAPVTFLISVLPLVVKAKWQWRAA